MNNMSAVEADVADGTQHRGLLSEPGQDGTLADSVVHTSCDEPTRNDPSVSDAAPPVSIDFVPGSTNDPHRSYRIGQHLLIFGGYFVLGLCAAMIGPTVPDLKQRLDVDYKSISSAIAMWCVGYVVGNILSGILFERYRRYMHITEVICAASFCTGGAANIAIPFARHVSVLGVMFTVTGMVDGVIATGTTNHAMNLWGRHASGPLFSLFAGSSAGSLISPQIAKPFLSSSVCMDLKNTTAWQLDVIQANTSESCEEFVLIPSRIEICYGIAGVLCLLIGCCNTVMYFKGPALDIRLNPQITNPEWTKMVHPASCSKGSTYLTVSLLIILFIYCFQAHGIQICISRLLFSFAVEADVNFTKQSASQLQTVYWACFLLGRSSGVPLSKYVPVWVIMISDIVLLTAASILMSTYGIRYGIALWLTASVMGFCVSRMFATGMAWSNLYINMNNISVMLMFIAGGLGGLVYQYIAGALLEDNPSQLPVVVAASGGCLVVTFIILQVLARCQKKNLSRSQNISSVEVEDKCLKY